MNVRAGVLALTLGLGLCGGLAAQVTVGEAAARATIVRQVDPVYPVRARETHLTGNVLVQVKIGANGRVESAQAVSGAMTLRAAALDAVRQWEFAPRLVDGLATSVNTMLTIPFPAKKARPDTVVEAPAAAAATRDAAAPAPALEAAKAAPAKPAEGVSRPDDAVIETNAEQAPPVSPAPPADLKLATQYFELAAACDKALAARGSTAGQASVCKTAADTADEFAPDTRYTARRSAYVYYATALMRNKQFSEAVQYGAKAVAVVKLGHDDAAGSSAAYTVKGQAEALAGDLESANADLLQAETFQRNALQSLSVPKMEADYKRSLKGIMTLRSQVLGAMGKDAESDKLAAEADKL